MKIANIEFVGHYDTIDIEIDGDQLFFANGLVSHNSGMQSSDAGITDVSESWGLPATVDWFLIVIQPDELVELGQYLCKQEKSRYSNKDKMRKFLIGVDKGKQKLYDLDKQPNLAGGQYEADLPVFDQGAIVAAEAFNEFRE